MKVVLAQNVSLHRHLALSTYLRSIAKYLAAQDDIELYLIIQGPVDRSTELDPSYIRYLDSDTYSISGNATYAWKTYRALCELQSEVGIDLIHCLYPNSSLQAAAFFKLTRAPKVKIVYDLRSPWIEASVERLSLHKGTSIYRKLAYGSETLLSRFVDGHIFITKGLKDFYEERLGTKMEPSCIIPSGVDTDIFFPRDPAVIREKLGISEDDIVIGYAGVLSAERELEFALQALKNLRDNDKRYKMIFVGDGNGEGALRKMAADLGLGDGVIFTGRVDFSDVPYYISAFDYGLCHLPDKPFFRNSFPMKVLEYAACGIPVLASHIPAHEDISDQLPVILYSNSSPINLSKTILESSTLYRDYDHKAVREFGWDRLVSRLVDFYRFIMGR